VAKNGKQTYRKDELWIAPTLSFKKPTLQSDWKLERSEPEESNRFLELADIALGSAPEKHMPERRKMKRSA
jgi:hypothetical protein